MPVSTAEWSTLAMIISPWAIVAAVIIRGHSFGQYGERAAIEQARAETRLARTALRVAHDRELATLQAEIDTVRELIAARAENVILRNRESA